MLFANYSLSSLRHHPNIKGDFLKNVQETSTSVLMTFMINGNENEVENQKQIKKIDLNRLRPEHGHKFTYI